MNLHENIRRARLDRGMTQAALADLLGVSDRAVSRWETGAACPDVTLLSRLAMALETSTDALLGMDPLRVEAAVFRAAEEATRLLQAGDVQLAVSMLREKAALYPHQPELMVALARALLKTGDVADAQEALSLCRAADQCRPGPGRPMRLSAVYGGKQVMALALKQLGRREETVRIATDELPAIFVSRELLLARVAPPEQAAAIRRSNVRLLGTLMLSAAERVALEAPELGAPSAQLRDAVEAYCQAIGV